MGDIIPHRKTAWSGNKAERGELRNLVWDMRLEHYTFRQIGEALGISHQFAMDLEREAFEARGSTNRDNLVAQMEERLGAVSRKCLKDWVEKGDMKALDAYRWSEERLAKLRGLDAPVVTKSEVTTVDPMDAALADVIAEAKAAEEVARARATE